MRTTATKLANVIAEGDFIRSRAGLIDLASACNDCHASFRIAARVIPFADQPEPRRAKPVPPVGKPSVPTPAIPPLASPPKPDVGPRSGIGSKAQVP